MRRIAEPELMIDPEQARIYAEADFEEAHSRIVEMFDTFFPGTDIKGHILDLGCGSGDITCRFASKFPESIITGVDGSSAMLEQAELYRGRTGIANRINFVKGCIPEAPISQITYDAIVSNSLLHHLHNPDVLWETVNKYSLPGTKIYIVDLCRPSDKAEAERIVKENAGNEPEILQRDFYNSLLAAFEIEEVKEQLAIAGLPELAIEMISDRHMAIYGVKQ